MEKFNEAEKNKTDGKDKKILKEEVTKKEEALLLATEIDKFIYEYDTSQYNEVIDNREKQIEELTTDIVSGDSDYLKFFLQGIADQDAGREDAKKANELLEKLSDYKPLAKVEELEEANYNMIDNVLNNMKPKKENEGKENKERVSMKDKLSEMKEKANGISRKLPEKEKSHELNM